MAKAKSDNKIVKLNVKKDPFKKIGVDFTLLFAVLILLVTGLTMLFSVSSAANMTSGNVYSPIIKQSILAAVGLCGMVCLSKLDYKLIRKYSGVLESPNARSMEEA